MAELWWGRAVGQPSHASSAAASLLSSRSCKICLHYVLYYVAEMNAQWWGLMTLSACARATATLPVHTCG
jgi:hypothetical protein